MVDQVPSWRELGDRAWRLAVTWLRIARRRYRRWKFNSRRSDIADAMRLDAVDGRLAPRVGAGIMKVAELSKLYAMADARTGANRYYIPSTSPITAADLQRPPGTPIDILSGKITDGLFPVLGDELTSTRHSTKPKRFKEIRHARRPPNYRPVDDPEAEGFDG